jgi:5-(carboxyamino)imidazole ribonucleotide synthase
MSQPGQILGILGGGQLGRMLALAAATLGIRCHVFAPESDSPAFDVAAFRTAARYTDAEALARFAASVDVVTYEFENVPTETLDILQEAAPDVPVRPGRRALSITQDRLLEKAFITDSGLTTAPFADISRPAALEAALQSIGTPAILKTRRFGYDGKGQIKIASAQEGTAAWDALDRQPAILEGFVPFVREVSVLVARTADGKSATYDVCENSHRNHILARTVLPANLSPASEAFARDAATLLADALDYVGLMAVEMFVTEQNGRQDIVINEIAPRVHNSGHWTIEGADTSQFLQHVRAVMDLPLGSTLRRHPVEMENLLGQDMDRVPALLAEPGAHLHLYGKLEARTGRKMGHVTRLLTK